MKRILILSDTHRRISSAEKLIRLMTPNAVIHLGDLVSDAEELSFIFPEIPFHMVRGNNDYEPIDSEKIVTLFGHRLFLAHGHTINEARGIERAKETNCQAFLYGHSHIGKCEKRAGILLLNPGSLTAPRDGIFSFGIIETDGDGIHGCVCPAEGYISVY